MAALERTQKPILNRPPSFLVGQVFARSLASLWRFGLHRPDPVAASDALYHSVANLHVHHLCVPRRHDVAAVSFREDRLQMSSQVSNAARFEVESVDRLSTQATERFRAKPISGPKSHSTKYCSHCSSLGTGSHPVFKGTGITIFIVTSDILGCARIGAAGEMT